MRPDPLRTPIVILLADDDPDDRMLTRLAMAESRLANVRSGGWRRSLDLFATELSAAKLPRQHFVNCNCRGWPKPGRNQGRCPSICASIPSWCHSHVAG